MNPELTDLIAQPLAFDPRGVPKLLTMIRGEAASLFGEPELPPIATYHTAAGEIAAEDADDDGHRRGSLVAVVPLRGVVMRGTGWWGHGTADLTRQLSRLDANPSIGSIVLDINSPGGMVYGTEEMGDAVRSIREGDRTHISAAVDPLMASAATWIGTATEEVWAIPSADVGSIGVISIYGDMSRMYSDVGIDISVIRNPDKKARFTGIEPMSDSMREDMEARSVETYDRFIDSMANNRGVTREHVVERFGGGEVMRARDAVDAGLIDRLGSIDELIAERLSATSRSAGGTTQSRRRRLALMQL